MSLRKETPCDYGECPYDAETNSTCEYWCGEEEPEDYTDVDDETTSEDLFLKAIKHLDDDYITEERFMELAQVAISYIKDNGLLEDFMEDRSITFSPYERNYFECNEESED